MFINPSFWSFKHRPLVTVAFEYCLMIHVHWSRGGHYLYTYTRRTLLIYITQARIQDFTLGGALLGEGSRAVPGGGTGERSPLKFLGIRKYRTSFLNRNWFSKIVPCAAWCFTSKVRTNEVWYFTHDVRLQGFVILISRYPGKVKIHAGKVKS